MHRGVYSFKQTQIRLEQILSFEPALRPYYFLTAYISFLCLGNAIGHLPCSIFSYRFCNSNVRVYSALDQQHWLLMFVKNAVDLLYVPLLVFPVNTLRSFDVSRIYQKVLGNYVIKLYVVFNVIDVFDWPIMFWYNSNYIHLFTDCAGAVVSWLSARFVNTANKSKVDVEASVYNFMQEAKSACVHLLLSIARGVLLGQFSWNGISSAVLHWTNEWVADLLIINTQDLRSSVVLLKISFKFSLLRGKRSVEWSYHASCWV